MRMVMISERDLSQTGTGRLAYRAEGSVHHQEDE